jgi:hypothetical protein
MLLPIPTILNTTPNRTTIAIIENHRMRLRDGRPIQFKSISELFLPTQTIDDGHAPNPQVLDKQSEKQVKER